MSMPDLYAVMSPYTEKLPHFCQSCWQPHAVYNPQTPLLYRIPILSIPRASRPETIPCVFMQNLEFSAFLVIRCFSVFLEHNLQGFSARYMHFDCIQNFCYSLALWLPWQQTLMHQGFGAGFDVLSLNPKQNSPLKTLIFNQQKKQNIIL